jgi:UDP-N-acetyl-2-amino-2-deoxyglucuronate dehydrogenase
MSKDGKIKLGLIGFGTIAQKHYSALSELESDISIEAIVDSNPEVEAFCKEISIDYFKDVDDLLVNKTLDLGSICTPTGSHAMITEKLSSKGVNVLTEKPLATSYEDGLSMVECCKKKGVKLFTVKQFRNNPLLMATKKAVDQGSFGKIYMVNSNVFWTRPQAYYDSDAWRGTVEHDGGAVMNQASHFVDVLSWLMGDIDYIQCTAETLARNIEVEDSAVANIRWKNGAIGSFSVTMLTYDRNLEGSITILGEKGSVKISGTFLNELDHWNFEDSQSPSLDIKKLQSISMTNFQKQVSHKSVYENIIKDLKGEETKNITYGNEALKSLEMIIGMYESSKEGVKKYFPIR